MMDLKNRRQALHRSQLEMSQLLGIPLRTYVRWETEGCPHAKMLELALAHLVGDVESSYATGGPTEMPSIIPSRRRMIDRGDYWISYWRLADGAWLEQEQVSALSPDSFYWETIGMGRWAERQRGANSDARRHDKWTGRYDHFPPFLWWKPETFTK